MFAKYLSAVLLLTVLLAASNVSAFKIEPRIANGHTSDPNQFPYHALLAIGNNNEVFQTCGGTLIDSKWILTAAHCLENADEVAVYLGASKITNFLETKRATSTTFPRSFHIHPNYSLQSVEHDIALIKLIDPIALNASIQPAKLPQTCDLREDMDVIAIGNGNTKNEMLSETLQYAEMKVISTEVCKEMYDLEYGRGVICVQGDNKESICDKDDGSALIRKSDNAVIGVANLYHPDGFHHGLPQAFTSIFAYSEWITKITGLKLPECKTNEFSY